ncbi:MAG: lysozyme inhibitor LprI family protein [Legionella sp.]|jgi:uncharacterized protein YecT (DUF1311 family)
MHKIIMVLLIVVSSLVNGRVIAEISHGNWEFVAEKVKRTCESVKDLTIPLQDMPDEITKKTITTCDSEESYYGFESPPDYVKARHCAIINHNYDILAMIYANGKGVKSNFDLGIHFACLYGGTGAEIDGRVKELMKAKVQNAVKKDFYMCNYATSREMMGYCTSIDKQYADVEQKNHLTVLIKTFTPAEKNAFQKLQKSSVFYFEARVENEMDRFGSGALAGGVSEMMTLNSSMVELLDKTIQCKLPSYSSENYQKADGLLNSLYKKSQNKPDKEFMVTRAGIKKTERAWIKYKDSWVEFGHIKCPMISENTWKTFVTRERIEQLKVFAR